MLPPDLRAYRAALAIGDPPARIAALSQWLKDYPASPGAANVRREILNAHASVQPPDPKQLRLAAEQLIAGARPDDRDAVRIQAAEQYAARGLILGDCARWAIEAARSDLALRRAEALAALGLVRKQQRDWAAAEKALREAIDLNPALPRAFVTLGQVKLATQQYRQSLQLLSESHLEGHLPQAAWPDLEAAWTALRETGSLEDALDRRYRERYPNPIETEPYAPTAARGDRVVLVEAVTGASCLPCAAADLAVEAALERYSRTELAVAMYHVHVPVTDPLTAPGNDRRHAAFQSAAVPLWAVDGAVHRAAGGLREHTPRVWQQLQAQIDRQLEQPSQASIQLSARRGPQGVEARVAFSSTASGPVTIRLLLVEKLQRYSGRNGIRFHPMVVRSIEELRVDGAEGRHVHLFDVAAIDESIRAAHDEAIRAALSKRPAGDETTASLRIDPKQLAIIASIENGERQVLQSAFAEVTQ